MPGGQTFMVSKVISYWALPFDAPSSTLTIPGLDVPYNGTWGAGWNKIVDTVTGVRATFRNPRVAVNSEERGRLGQLPSGDEGVTIAMQFVSIEMPLLQRISAMISNTIAARNHVATLSLTSGVGTNGTFSITLNGVVYSVAGATTASQGTAANLATYLRTPGNYSPSLPTTGVNGWTLGGTGSDVVFTATDSSSRSGSYALAPAATGVAGTFAQTAKGHGSADIMHLDKNAPMGIAIGFEGIAVAGSLFTGRRWIRGIAYHAENTANTEHPHGHTGLDAVFRPSATFECQPAVVIPSAALTGTDLTADVLDPNKRFDYMFIDAPEQ